MSVEALDTLVTTVVATMWGLAALALIVGYGRLSRRRKPFTPRPAQHRAPALWVRALEAYLDATREASAAYALLRGHHHVA